MVKREIKTDRAPKPRGQCSQGIVAGNRIYVSGQYPVDSENRRMPLDIATQTRLALTNIKNIIEAGGGRMENVVKCTVHLANLSDFDEFNTAYAEFFKAPYPVCTTVGGALLGKALIEIDAVAEI
ncbi:MAG: Rid family detoxifying hydrolase [Synergistaceae bacterium]|jgi:2-iminobutanoate/2-iminopropanoate deaminase|nr:Rid family detoxifying hydrolase [Synergistaceae bacterium]